MLLSGSQALYKPHWHSTMMVPTHGSTAWINQFSKPSLVQSPTASTTPNYPSHHTQQQQSPQSSYPPTPPKEDLRAGETESVSAFTPTTNSAFAYTDYQNAASYKQNSTTSSQNDATSPLSKHNKSRTRTGTGISIHLLLLVYFMVDFCLVFNKNKNQNNFNSFFLSCTCFFYKVMLFDH